MSKSISCYVAPGTGTEADPEYILSTVAGYYGVTTEDLKVRRNYPKHVIPRQVAMYLYRKFTGFSLRTIGQICGGLHHATVLYAITAVNNNALTNYYGVRDAMGVLEGQIASLRSQSQVASLRSQSQVASLRSQNRD